jgi:lysozyme
MDTTLIEMVARHEGFRATVYCDACGNELYFYHGDEPVWLCSKACKGGNLTVGYGTRVDGAGITPAEAEALLAQRLEELDWELRKDLWFAALDTRRQEAILDMAYAMGVAGVRGFKEMIAALEAKDWVRAGFQVGSSKWARQAPSRAHDIAAILMAG